MKNRRKSIMPIPFGMRKGMSKSRAAWDRVRRGVLDHTGECKTICPKTGEVLKTEKPVINVEYLYSVSEQISKQNERDPRYKKTNEENK